MKIKKDKREVDKLIELSLKTEITIEIRQTCHCWI